jgi:hypothetical protein
MPVVSFPLSPERALVLIREAARSGRVSIPSPPSGDEWYRLVTHRQVDLCLREGDLIGDPVVDQFGNVRCLLERFGAGMLVRVRIALSKVEPDETWRIIVLEVENRV